MQNEPRRRVETIFHAARSRHTGSERQAYLLYGACGDDADLRSRVDALLAAHVVVPCDARGVNRMLEGA